MDWNTILTRLVDACVNIAWRLIISLVILIIGRFIIKFVLKKMRKSNRIADKLDPSVRKFLLNIVKFGLYVVLAVCIVGTLGVEMTSVITVLASAGAAVALAVKGAFSNLVGGVMLIIFKPISIDEFVEIGGKSGTVEDIGIFYTQLRTGDNLTISVPNSVVVDSVTINYSRKDTRRIDLALDVAYGTDVEKAKQVIRDVISSHEKALTDPAPFVRMTAMNDSAIVITARVWCAKGDFGTLKSDLLEALNTAFESNGIDVPFPQLEIHTK